MYRKLVAQSSIARLATLASERVLRSAKAGGFWRFPSEISSRDSGGNRRRGKEP
jgi:hypothetical protein